MPQEIKIDGIGISPDVLTAIVSRAVSDVEGIASVGVKDLATNLVSMMLSSKAPASEPAILASKIEDISLAPDIYFVPFINNSSFSSLPLRESSNIIDPHSTSSPPKISGFIVYLITTFFCSHFSRPRFSRSS